jgi:hypothetical protein
MRTIPALGGRILGAGSIIRDAYLRNTLPLLARVAQK